MVFGPFFVSYFMDIDGVRNVMLYITKYKGWDFVCREFHDQMDDLFLVEFMPYIDIDLIAIDVLPRLKHVGFWDH